MKITLEQLTLEQLELMQKDLFEQQCNLDIQKAMVKHFIKKEKASLLKKHYEILNKQIKLEE